MNRFRRALAAGALVTCVAASPAHAQTDEAGTIEPSEPMDPILLSKARIIAGVLIPDGAFERMFGPMVERLIKPVTDKMMGVPLADLARIGGFDPEDLKGLDQTTLREIMEILDPAFQERLSLAIESSFKALGPVMTQFEPDVREGMAEAFVNRYSEDELDEINVFLATPVGARFGTGFLALASDPAYLNRMQGLVPRIVDAMPAIAEEVAETTSALPKPRSWADLGEAERERLMQLLDLDEDGRKQ